MVLGALVLAFATFATAFQEGQPSADQVKAVFLFNFAQFVSWPNEAFAGGGSPLVIGILGSDPFGSYLDETVRGETVRGRPLVIRRLQSVQDASGCQILYISRSLTPALLDILGTLKGRPVLTVGDQSDFLKDGGAIQFVIERNHVRLRINPAVTEAAGLTVSSKLLHVADVVPPGAARHE
jgi:hypothetical protein